MRNLRSTSILLTITLLLVACSGTADAPGDTSTTASDGSTTTAPSEPTTSTPPDDGTTVAPDQPPDGGGAIVDWVDPTKGVDVGDGWFVAACEGDAPILCVERDGEIVGGVEAQKFPISSLTFFDPNADDATNLAALADDFIDVFVEDRAIGCGEDYELIPVPPAPFVLANTPGVVYGFEGKLGDGTQSEFNLHYTAVVGEDVVSISASAYDEGGCPGRDDLGGFDSQQLKDFRPYLEEILHESPLPDLS